jgi:hypothetical protein
VSYATALSCQPTNVSVLNPLDFNGMNWLDGQRTINRTDVDSSFFFIRYDHPSEFMIPIILVFWSNFYDITLEKGSVHEIFVSQN